MSNLDKPQDFLIEIQTEELPPKSLYSLSTAFCEQIKERLQKLELTFDGIQTFATPRRLAIFLHHLSSLQKEQIIERKGPAMNAAFDAAGKPTPACIGFAKSCGVLPSDLITIKNNQGEWVGYTQHVPGKKTIALLPALIEQTLLNLPIAKRMRWGSSDTLFVRPIHSLLMLYGKQVIPATLMGLTAGNITRGHRFLSSNSISISSPSTYESELEKVFVMASFSKRRDYILSETQKCLSQLKMKTDFVADQALIDEVTGLVEWPVILLGQFDEDFLKLPEEVLISAMQDHQRYFPIRDASTHKLIPYFVIVSNLSSRDASRVIQGNERVLRARLSDAAFFYEEDKKETLTQRLERLRGIIFQAKLGSLYDKAKRLSQLAGFIAKKWKLDVALTQHAALLAKTDLTTHMVGEFPELQGTMGAYYARLEKEPEDVALAIKEHYFPRFAGGPLPAHPMSQAIAIADRLDTLLGIFGIQQIPTGDKDPFALRRAALGIVRILIENKLHLDLRECLHFAATSYDTLNINEETVSHILNFIQERMRAWYSEQGMTADVFAAVAALNITDPLDMHARIQAVHAFKQLSAAEALSLANKRVNNIIEKYAGTISNKQINPHFFEQAEEKELAHQLEMKSQIVMRLSQEGDYNGVLLQLAELHQPVDNFFDHVLVMTDDTSRRENRILLLNKLRDLFLKVADIALLQ